MIWRIKFIDLSKWQGDVDFVALRAMGYDYVLLRITSGASYKDERFHEYYSQAKAAGFKIGVYFVINPLFSAAAHWQTFVDHLGGREIDIVPTADVELDSGLSNTLIALRVRETLELFRTNFTAIPGGPIIYTAVWFWDARIGNVSWALNYSLHVAQYPWLTPPAELPADRLPTAIPLPWKNASRNPIAWQWTDKGRLTGVTTASLDFNVGWDSLFRLVYGYLPGEEPPPEPPIPVDQDLLARINVLETTTKAISEGIAGLRITVAELQNSNQTFAGRLESIERNLDAEIVVRSQLSVTVSALQQAVAALRAHLRNS